MAATLSPPWWNMGGEDGKDVILLQAPALNGVASVGGETIRNLKAAENQLLAFFRERTGGTAIRVIEGESWDTMAHASLALAASGTVTVEAALLGTPMVSFYRVTAVSWLLGKLLVRVPFYSMVNLIAGRAVVPELMQSQMTGERIASEARRLLGDEGARHRMLAGLAEVRKRLEAGGAPSAATPAARAAAIVREILQGDAAHVS